MLRNTVYEASGIGESLLAELLRRGDLELRIMKRTSNNIYCVLGDHLVPIGMAPLVTPFTLSLTPEGGPVKVFIRDDSVILLIIGKPLVYMRPGESKAKISEWRKLAKISSIMGSLIREEIDLYLARLIFKILNYSWPDPGRVIEESQQYLGLGSGSTPSLDDFLAGYITGWGKYLQPKLELRNTTQLSRVLLSEVLKDRDYLIDVATLREYAKGRGDIFEQALRVVAIGGTSGLFMLLGIASALLQKVGARNTLLKLWRAVVNMDDVER